eukprot:GEMP01006823.1.p1 GENE.GEMP01006823.1~~GEMP01006823.1.p1  ORF type:complete len:425 (+),score=101.75 GEMP01006823.1:220-1494(+)
MSRDSVSSVHHDLDAETEKMARGLMAVKSVKLSAYSTLTLNNYSRNVDMLFGLDAVTSQLKTYLHIFEYPDFTEAVELALSRVSDLDAYFTEWQDQRTKLESTMKIGAETGRAEMVKLLDDANHWRERARDVSRATSELCKRGERILARVSEDEEIDARFLELTDAHNARSGYSTKLRALLQLILYRTQKLPCGPSVEMYPRSKKLSNPLTLDSFAKQRETRVRSAFQTMISEMKAQIGEARKTAHIATEAVDYCLDRIHALSLRLTHHQELLDDLAAEESLAEGGTALLAHLTTVVAAMQEAADDIARLELADDRASVIAFINFIDFDLGPLPFPPLPSDTSREDMFPLDANATQLHESLGSSTNLTSLGTAKQRDALRHYRTWSTSLSQLMSDPEIDAMPSRRLSDLARESSAAPVLDVISE